MASSSEASYVHLRKFPASRPTFTEVQKCYSEEAGNTQWKKIHKERVCFIQYIRLYYSKEAVNTHWKKLHKERVCLCIRKDLIHEPSRKGFNIYILQWIFLAFVPTPRTLVTDPINFWQVTKTILKRVEHKWYDRKQLPHRFYFV